MDTGHAAWILMSASLVLLMTPGLALFYGGMTRATSVLNMMMMSFGAMGVVGVVYVLWGWSMSYGEHDVAMLFSDPFEMFGLAGVAGADYVSVAFQLTFAVIAAALISGAVADRVKFSTWLAFVPLWVTLSYFPLAHMVWGGGFLSDAPGGLADLLTDGTAPVDYAGGTVVHINAGVAALVLAVVIGVRRGFGRDPVRPHNLPFTMLGAGLLWFGWFGFNVGSFVDTGERPLFETFAAEAGLVWVNTTAATAAAMLGWLLVERLRDGRGTSLGAASGVVAGLVAITPACGALSPVGSLALGVLAGAAAALAVGLKYRFGYDDSLDVVGVHLVSGLVGTVAIGLLATDGGLLYGGSAALLLVQVAIALFAMLWSGLATAVVALLLRAVLGWRVADEHEVAGIDLGEHGESAYDVAGTSRRGPHAPALPVAAARTEGATA